MFSWYFCGCLPLYYTWIPGKTDSIACLCIWIFWTVWILIYLNLYRFRHRRHAFKPVIIFLFFILLTQARDSFTLHTPWLLCRLKHGGHSSPHCQLSVPKSANDKSVLRHITCLIWVVSSLCLGSCCRCWRLMCSQFKRKGQQIQRLEKKR